MTDLCEIVLDAIRAEIESMKFYEKLAAATKNFLLRDKLAFLASEENSHKRTLHKLLRDIAPEKTEGYENRIAGILAEEFKEPFEGTVSDLLFKAADFEKRSSDFYREKAKLFEKEGQKMIFFYLSVLEDEHYAILMKQYGFYKENEKFEDYNEFIHLGP